jgi:hypothetical protein
LRAVAQGYQPARVKPHRFPKKRRLLFANIPKCAGMAGPNLLKGCIDRFAPGNDAHDLSLDCWVAICREAERLWRHCQKDATTGAAQPAPSAAVVE